jgi:2-(1,2-epoxy-1,2-dihydrophenyl)acetyl-CoA isomerase
VSVHEPELIVERRGAVASIVLCRPERLNAFTETMIDMWVQSLGDLKEDASCHVIILTGRGRGFCSGADVGGMSDGGPLAKKELLWERVHRIPLLLEQIDKPVIAMINGVAFGAGLDMALMCDVRIACESARLGTGYVGLGMVPGDGGAYYLPRLVGVARALELFWSGEMIDGRRASEMGLVNRCVPDGELESFTFGLAERIAAQPQLAVRMTKRAVYQSSRIDLRAALDLISSHMAVVQASDESRAALAIARERRANTAGGGGSKR